MSLPGVKVDWTIFTLITSTFFVGFSLGMIIERARINTYWKEDAIKRGYAEYSSTSGEWKWKQPTGIE